ncbi:hypothetical protein J7E70_34590 [Variovorax paradoxus]|nr:hypothetical protein [Variovorax paradoxus]MBT2305521.1 hypothetical protein [Variovorax paradoxus]
MGDPLRPLQPGQPAPAFALPAVNLEGTVSLADLRRAIFEKHGTQLAGHFLVDAAGLVAWVQIEALDGPNSLGREALVHRAAVVG